MDESYVIGRVMLLDEHRVSMVARVSTEYQWWRWCGNGVVMVEMVW